VCVCVSVGVPAWLKIKFAPRKNTESWGNKNCDTDRETAR